MGISATSIATDLEKSNPRFGERMAHIRAYQKITRATVRTDTQSISVDAWRDLALLMDQAQQMLRLEVLMSGGDFDALYIIAKQEGELCAWCEEPIGCTSDVKPEDVGKENIPEWIHLDRRYYCAYSRRMATPKERHLWDHR